MLVVEPLAKYCDVLFLTRIIIVSDFCYLPGFSVYFTPLFVDVFKVLRDIDLLVPHRLCLDLLLVRQVYYITSVFDDVLFGTEICFPCLTQDFVTR